MCLTKKKILLLTDTLVNPCRHQSLFEWATDQFQGRVHQAKIKGLLSQKVGWVRVGRPKDTITSNLGENFKEVNKEDSSIPTGGKLMTQVRILKRTEKRGEDPSVVDQGVNLQDEEVIFGDGYDHAQERGVFCFKNEPPNIDEGTKGLRAGLHVDNPQTSYVPESPNAGAGSPVKLEKTIWILSFLTPLSKWVWSMIDGLGLGIFLFLHICNDVQVSDLEC